MVSTKSKGVYLGDTKTIDVRYLNLPDETVSLLRQYRREQLRLQIANGDRWTNSGYVFTQDNGKHMNPDSITDFCESDDAFHELLMSTLPNKYLRSAYDRITGLNTRFRIMTGKVSMINQEQTCDEHLEILDAALADNWDLAADSLQHHLELARDKAEGVIKVIRLW